MNPSEQQLIAGYADWFRRNALSGDTEQREMREFMARGLEKHLSRELVSEYQRGTTRPSEDARSELTREQSETLKDLAHDHDEVRSGRFFPDGSVEAECWDYDERGEPVLTNVHRIEKGGIPF